MNVSRDEAAAALEHVEQADARVRTWRSYGWTSPYLVTWGSIWLVANVLADYSVRAGNAAWLAGIIVGALVTTVLTIQRVRRVRREQPASSTERREIGRRVSMLGITVMAWFPVMAFVAGPLSPRQGNAMISLTWAFIYMAAGAFIGWRLFAIGAATAAAIVFGYFTIDQHFQLWMGVVGGGSLIAGGLWLRKL